MGSPYNICFISRLCTVLGQPLKKTHDFIRVWIKWTMHLKCHDQNNHHDMILLSLCIILRNKICKTHAQKPVTPLSFHQGSWKQHVFTSNILAHFAKLKVVGICTEFLKSTSMSLVGGI